MADKSADRVRTAPKGPRYCEQPYVSCYYNARDVCVNCARPKGWRLTRANRARLDRIRGR